MPSAPAKLQQRNRELSILNAIAREFNRSVDLEQILQAALAQVADLLDLKTGWIWLLHPEDDQPYLAASQNLPPALAQGLQNKEIADRLFIGERTAKFHVSAILRKLDAGNRTEAVAIAAQQGLVKV